MLTYSFANTTSEEVKRKQHIITATYVKDAET